MFRKDALAIRDEYGRQRIFKGANLCIKNDEFNHKVYRLEKKLDKQFDDYIKNGVSIVRLGFTWSALEPKENLYDEKAFDFLKAFTARCQSHGIYVLLDLHQDLFCSLFHFGDGAPRWVTSDYKKKRPLAIWAEGYFYFRDVQRAFDDFWHNKNDMQTKYIALWSKIVDEFKQYDNVIGLDFMNEPMITENSNRVFCCLINNAVKVGLDKEFHAEKYFENGRERRGFIRLAFALWKNIRTIGNLKKFLVAIDDYDKFSFAVDGLERYTKDFNRDYYQPFFDTLANNNCNEKTLAFFEHNYYSNLGIPFEIDVKDNYIYSPHAYDLFIDSPLYNSYSSNARIKCIIDSIRQNQLRMNVPVIMGEWGGSANGGHRWIEHVNYVYSLFEENQWSSIYWNYLFKNKEFTQVMNRPYPLAVCGDIISYSTNNSNRTFKLEYTCNENTAPTVVYVPNKGYVEFENQIGANKIELQY